MTGKPQDEYHRLRSAYLRLRAALRDPMTGLYSFTVHFDEIRALLKDRVHVGVVWVSLGDRHMLEAVYGWQAYDRLLSRAADLLEEIRSALLGDEAVLAIQGVHSDAFLLFTPGTVDGLELDASRLVALTRSVEDQLDASLSDHGLPPDSFPGGLRVGGALLTENPFCRFERRVYRAIAEAQSLAERPTESERLGWLVELQRLLREQDVRTVFQPLVDLSSGETIGVEAYSRGPAGSPLTMPRVMFSLGREAGLVGDLDKLCRNRALSSLGESRSSGLVFLNTTVESLVDPDWTSADALSSLGKQGLSPEQIVLDLSEEDLGRNNDFDAALGAIGVLRDAGYQVSLDNAGSSGRTVELVERLRPEFLKFDITLVRGVAHNQLGRELVRSLSRLARKAGARLVAERVETAEERDVLTECGADVGQGHFFDALLGHPMGPGSGTNRPGAGL